MHQSRRITREYAIILFCLLGVSSLNAWANNGYVADMRAVARTVLKAFGKDGVKSGYERMTLYQLLDKHASDPKAVEAMKGVAIEGEILRETAINPEDANASQAEKVTGTFKLSRYFSETGSEEGAHIISVQVNCPKAQGLRAGMWVRVQGQVKTLASGADEGKPVIEAGDDDSVVEAYHNKEQSILTPQGEAQPAEAGGGEEGHAH